MYTKIQPSNQHWIKVIQKSITVIDKIGIFAYQILIELNMKKIMNVFLVVLFAGFIGNNAIAQSKWPEKDAFHAVMSTTFHPSEEGNLEPIKTRSGEMVLKAKEWMNSTPPAEFKKKSIKKKLKLLYKESVALDKLIKDKGTDDQIKKSLAKLHDRFHQIAEICHHEGKDHKDH